jgi:hypothetical protein
MSAIIYTIENTDTESLLIALADYNYEKFYGTHDRKACNTHHGHRTLGGFKRDRFFYNKRDKEFIRMEIIDTMVLDAIEDTQTTDNGGFSVWIDLEGYHTLELMDREDM